MKKQRLLIDIIAIINAILIIGTTIGVIVSLKSYDGSILKDMTNIISSIKEIL